MDEFNLAMLIIRVSLGITMATHGYAKFFKGGRIAGTAGWFDSMGMRPGKVHARLAAGGEIASGLCLALGFLTTFACLGFVGLMAVAAYTVHLKNGFMILNEGWEYVFVLAVTAVTIAMLGPGELVDRRCDRHRRRSRRLHGSAHLRGRRALGGDGAPRSLLPSPETHDLSPSRRRFVRCAWVPPTTRGTCRSSCR